MKLSKETVAILKNFANISGNLLVKPGSKVTTISTGKSLYAEAIVAENFDTEFGIYDLNEFLGALALYDDPEVTFEEKFARIKEGKNGVKFFAADVSILVVPKSEPKLGDVDITFSLTADQLNRIQKAAGVLRAPDITFTGDGQTVTVLVGDRKNVTGNSYDVTVGTTDATFKAFFKVENIGKFVAGDYGVELYSGRKAARFISRSTTSSLQYVTPMEPDSSFN